VSGDVAVQNPAAVVRQDDEHEQHLEAHRGDGEEVDGDQVGRVVGEEGAPSGRRRLARANAVLLDSRLGDLDAELPELASDALGAPRGVGGGDLADEAAKLLRYRRTAALPPSPREPRPVIAEAPPLPGDYGVGLDQHQGIAPAGPVAREPRPEKAVGRSEASRLLLW
jgi:hypothetical protein